MVIHILKRDDRTIKWCFLFKNDFLSRSFQFRCHAPIYSTCLLFVVEIEPPANFCIHRVWGENILYMCVCVCLHLMSVFHKKQYKVWKSFLVEGHCCSWGNWLIIQRSGFKNESETRQVFLINSVLNFFFQSWSRHTRWLFHNGSWYLFLNVYTYNGVIGELFMLWT